MKSGIYPELVLVLWAAQAPGTAGEVDLGATRGLPQRRARPRQRVERGAGPRREAASSSACASLSWWTSAPISRRGARAPPPTTWAAWRACTPRRPSISRARECSRNTTLTGPYRGAGRPEATYAIERVIDVAARELGIDSVELRRRNLIPPSAMPFKTGLVFTYDCGDFPRIMEQALAAADHAGFAARRAEARRHGKLLGLGIANPIEVAGGPYTAVNPDTAELRVNAGRLRLRVCRHDLDGAGERDGLHADRERSPRPAPRAHQGVLGGQRFARHGAGQWRIGGGRGGRIGGASRHREGDRARTAHRRAYAGGRAR